MKIENRLFPYPVLCDDNDDYVNCHFSVNVKMTEDLNDICLKFEVELDNEELLSLIRNGSACFLIHLECTSTSYRTTVKNAGTIFECKIPKSKVNKEVALVGMIVADENINGYYSKKFNEDYDEKINFDKGAILAYKNLPKLVIYKNYEELASDSAFFTMVSKTNEQNNDEPISFDLSGEKIKIFVDSHIYNEYIKFSTNSTMKPIMISMFVLPALIYMIDEVRFSGSEPYNSNYWYQKIKHSCELQGSNFEEDIINSDTSSVELAQKILKFPIGEAIRNLSTVVEE